jgi:hypothetical protein
MTAYRRALSYIVSIVAIFLAMGRVQTARADWYSGDPYLAATAWPQYTENLSNAFQELALTYDNFTWTPGAGGGVVDEVGGHFHSFNTIGGSVIDTAYWEIRTGMSHNVGGTLVASGSGVVTSYPTSFTQGTWPVWGVNVDVPNFTLPAGNYWFGLAIGTTSTDPNATSWFVASTAGTNGIGGPLGDDLSIYFQSLNNGANVTYDYTESAVINPTLTGFDPSYFIHEVPEPSTLSLFGVASACVAWRLLRKRRRDGSLARAAKSAA